MGKARGKSYSFNNHEIAKILNNVAAAYEVKNASKFRILAYQKAAVSVEHATSELKDFWDDGKLEHIPSIGKNLSSYLDELFRTGKVKHFDKILKELPAAMFAFLDIPGVGPKRAYILATKLKIGPKNAIKRLKKAAFENKIRVLENFGEKSEIEILEGIKALEKGGLKTRRMLLPYADELASGIVQYLIESPFVIEANPLGSLRRMTATIGDIDISVSTKKSKEVIEHFIKYNRIKTVLEKGEKSLIRVVLLSGQQVDIRLSDPEKYGAMLQYFTGSKQHNIELREYSLKKGYSLSEYGIKTNQKSNIKDQNQISKIKTFKDEQSFYNYIGLDYIPPELRESNGEISASINHRLPKLVDLSDIKGDLHLHSSFPTEPSHDLGVSEMLTMANEGIRRKYEYLGFSEHNPSFSRHSEEKYLDILKKKKATVEQLNYSLSHNDNKRVINIFNGLEVDIKPNGSLAIPENAFDLNLLDYIIASVHSEFSMNKDKMTQRVLKALDSPKVKIFGHPTGRLLEEREGYELDWGKIFEFCLKKKIWLEISAWPTRLDLPDTLVHEAVKLGVKLIIGSDSHHLDQMKMMKYGVAVARRGWSEKKDIINCLSYTEIENLLGRKEV